MRGVLVVPATGEDPEFKLPNCPLAFIVFYGLSVSFENAQVTNFSPKQHMTQGD